MTAHPSSPRRSSPSSPPIRVLRSRPQELFEVEGRALRLWQLRGDIHWDDALEAVPAGAVPHRVTQLSGEQDYAIAECACIEGYRRIGTRWGKGQSLWHDDTVQHRAWALLAYLRATRAVSEGTGWETAAAHAAAATAADQEGLFAPVEWLLAYERRQAASP